MTIGGIALFAGALMAFVRMEDSWAAFPLLVVLVIPLLVLVALALLPEREGLSGASAFKPAVSRLGAWQVAYLLGALVLLGFSLAQLVVVLGEDELGSANASWILAVVALGAATLARRHDVRAATLLSCVAFVFAVLAFADWTGDGTGNTTIRDVLLAAGIAFLALSRTVRRNHRDHSHLLVAVGAAALALGAAIGAAGEISFAFFFLGPEFGSPPDGGGDGDGWELILIAVSIGALVYAAIHSYRGSGYVGGAGLFGFVFLSGSGDLLGWPLVLVAVAVVAIAYSLRETSS